MYSYGCSSDSRLGFVVRVPPLETLLCRCADPSSRWPRLRRERSPGFGDGSLAFEGETTCTPRPPVVLTQDRRFSVLRTSRTSAAAFTTCFHVTRGPGSRSQTTRVGWATAVAGV